MSDMQPPPKRQRRVPDAERQRVSISCDRCKTRKIRCIRIGGENEPCAACAQLSLHCAATLPRKQRIYASYDHLLVRYRALEAMVKRMFPDQAIGTVEEIRELARKNGIDLSDMEEEGESQERERSESRNDDRLYASVQELKIPEGASIPAPRGGYHYVGPASSYLFANTIRHLVKKSSVYTMSFDRAGHRRQRRANEFTSANRTTALEARILGHPVMAASTDDASPMSESTIGPEIPSPQDRWTPRRFTGDLLPPRRVSDKLVKAFFDRVHPDFTLFHRGSFQVRYESIWSRQAEEDAESGWLCVLYMIYVLGAQSLERDGLGDATAIQERYLAIVIREGLQRLVLTATHSNVQALALLSLYQHNAGERNTAWMLIGHAARMGVALGMQRDGEHSNFDFIVRNTRRMVWWTLYLFEQNLSFILGRPSATSTLDISATLPDEAVMDGGNAPPGFLEHAVKLGDISAKIKRFVASVSTEFDKPDRLAIQADMATQLDGILAQWEQALPLHLRRTAQFATSKHLRSVLLLHAALFHLRSVVGRPFLLCKVNHQLDTVQSPMPLPAAPLSPATVSLANSSVNNARQCLETMITLASNGALEGELWYDYYYVHHSSLVLSLPFLVDATDGTDRGIVSTALNLAQKSRLAPTYRILVNVAIQFAKIVGIGPDDDPSRPSSPRSSASREETEPVNPAPAFDPNVQWSLPTLTDGNDWSLLPMVDPTLSQSLSLEQLLNMPQSTLAQARPPDFGFSDLHNFGFSLANEGPAPTAGSTMPWDFFAGEDWAGFGTDERNA